MAYIALKGLTAGRNFNSPASPPSTGLGKTVYRLCSCSGRLSTFGLAMYKDTETHPRLAFPAACPGDPPRLVTITQR